MTKRSTFDAALQELKEKLMAMVSVSQKALNDAIDALKKQDLEKADQIIENDKHINEMERDINELAIITILKQQPVASDLRRLIVALKISSDVERIGDIAVNIAKSVKFIGTEPHVKPIVHIPEMAAVVNEMLNNSLHAFHNDDIEEAKRIAQTDDRVDELQGQIIQELVTLMGEKPEYTNQITQLSFITRNLERAGDHITNIAENILYSVKGVRVDLNY
ncbi:PhoU-like phosphate uptake regulator [Thermolongibacillus altinsuensis]|uniref:Phosphate-specific transport system accessory protein PhoU n=1 Tax=Thermolongibacillus altinsuensis TaxID=575256 RepID=A0A4R1QH99_9BACL|nr:phosphate signaling complex protein PhoU [Thermolongibacillus altinsuensis]TCL49238.1 PhoU-like phosphate uptake regulator [Thermolongibacillus altinsuensis]GMB08686.1 phosphate transport system regulatory protein PhoU [Thermolongibacillus altinsuensis]